MPKSKINGVDLHWERSGEAGPGLVLVHGALVDHYSWGYLVPYLADTFRLLNYDRRGHSQSERVIGQSSLLVDMSDLAALITHFDLAPAHVFASSYGGLVTLNLAATQPELFRSLVAHEPPFLVLNEATRTNPEVAAVVQLQAETVAALETGQVESGPSRFLDGVVMPGIWDEFDEDWKQSLIFNAPTFIDAARDPEPWTVDLQKLANTSLPILLTQGENSPPFYGVIISQLHQALPTSQRIIIAGADHGPQASHPEAYAEIIKAFVRGETLG